MTSPTSNQLTSSKAGPFHPSRINEIQSIDQLHKTLRLQGCNGCDLGSQEGLVAPVVYRGNPRSGRLILGESPGMRENELGIPFCGPAGELNDKAFNAIEWDTNKDWCVSNTGYCRPIAPAGSGKQNLTPTAAQKKACKPYVLRVIELINPYLILLLGKSAVQGLLPSVAQGKSMEELAGKVYYHQQFPAQTFFIMYHPAAILHAQKKGPEEHKRLKKLYWEHLQLLKQVDEETRRS